MYPHSIHAPSPKVPPSNVVSTPRRQRDSDRSEAVHTIIPHIRTHARTYVVGSPRYSASGVDPVLCQYRHAEQPDRHRPPYIPLVRGFLAASYTTWPLSLIANIPARRSQGRAALPPVPVCRSIHPQVRPTLPIDEAHYARGALLALLGQDCLRLLNLTVTAAFG